MATYVLVPGAFAGGFYWRPVARLLRDAGHDVYTPTLTGVGERVHLAHPDVDLDTHIQDVVGVLDCEDLGDVVLVGHSYAGTVITGVAGRVPERLWQLVYLDARVPRDGESQLDNVNPKARAAAEAAVQREGDGWRLPVPKMRAGMAARWPYSKFADQPFKTFAQPLRLADPTALARLPRTYIRCTRAENTEWKRTYVAERTRGEGWRYHELPTGHLAMLTMPHELTRLLLAAIAPQA